MQTPPSRLGNPHPSFSFSSHTRLLYCAIYCFFPSTPLNCSNIYSHSHSPATTTTTTASSPPCRSPRPRLEHAHELLQRTHYLVRKIVFPRDPPLYLLIIAPIYTLHSHYRLFTPTPFPAPVLSTPTNCCSRVNPFIAHTIAQYVVSPRTPFIAIYTLQPLSPLRPFPGARVEHADETNCCSAHTIAQYTVSPRPPFIAIYTLQPLPPLLPFPGARVEHADELLQ